MATAAAAAILRNLWDDGWTIIWPAFCVEPAFGKEVIATANLSGRLDLNGYSITNHLEDGQLAEFYIWLFRTFPEVPTEQQTVWLGTTDRSSLWRNGILEQLSARGTETACEAIVRIGRELLGHDYLKWTLQKARDATRRRNWKPTRPEHILRMAADSTKRLVRGGDDLLAVVLESLERLSTKFRGETPLTANLWNEVSPRVWKPKDEEHLSDNIKQHLEDELRAKGVVLNREVVIRRSRGETKGERTDIHIDAVIPGATSDVLDVVTVMVDHVRMFRNHPQIRWTFRIHEQILPSIRATGGQVRWADVVINHTGYQKTGVRRGKQERDLRILMLAYQDEPDNPFTLFNLAQVYQEHGKVAEGLDFFQRSLWRSAPEDSIVRKLYARIAGCHHQLGQKQEALKAIEEACRYYPDDPEIRSQEALVRADLGDRPAAIRILQQILTQREGNHFASIDVGLLGYKTRNNLAVYLQAEGRLDEASEQWQLALAERPNFLPALGGLAEISLTRGNWTTFDQNLARMRQVGRCELEILSLTARKYLARREFPQAKELIHQAIALSPKAVWPRVVLSHILLQEGKDWIAAETALRDVLALDPKHAETRQNLQVLLSQMAKS